MRTVNQAPYAVIEQREQTPPFDLIASDRSPATIKTYAYSLLDWFRFLHRGEKTWWQAEPSDVRDYVLHLRTADKLLIVLPEADTAQRKTLSTVAELLQKSGHHIHVVQESELTPPRFGEVVQSELGI